MRDAVNKGGKRGGGKYLDDVGDIAKYSKLIGNSPLYGFDSFGQLKQFGAKIYNTFTKKGYKEVKVYMQGSSVTGRNSRSGNLFDVGRRSDFDIGIVCEELLNLAKLNGLVKTNRPFSLPLKLEEMKKMGLGDLAESLEKQFEREVNFRFYKTEESLFSNKGVRYTY